MPLSALDLPSTDPTPIFEHFRGSYGTELLVAAAAHLNLFEKLARGPMFHDNLRRELGLAHRPASVLFTALRSMGLVVEAWGNLELSALAKDHLVAGQSFDVSDYLGLAAQSPGVLEMLERLKTNKPAGAAKEGTAFIFREGIDSAMEQEASARRLTLSLAGRAKNVAPYLAAKLPLEGTKHLLDVGGGTGIYSIALLQKHPQLTATVLDGPEVLKVTSEMAAAYGVADRLTCLAGDMFQDTLPRCDAVLLSNVLHDWDIPQCRDLIRRSAATLPSGGKLLIHDVFLADTLDGPLPIALYSAALFTLTEGRAYSAAEYRAWLTECGLTSAKIIPTLIHCGVLVGTKR
jgi:predicted O-methyltransferase YrrM